MIQVTPIADPFQMRDKPEAHFFVIRRGGQTTLYACPEKASGRKVTACIIKGPAREVNEAVERTIRQFEPFLKTS